MKTITEYGSKKVERVVEALEAIKSGGKFNGTVYAKVRNKNNTAISVYVDSKEICFGDFQPNDVEAVKAEFIAAVATLIPATSIAPIVATKETLPAGNFGKGNYEFGTENWLFSGMNGE